MASDDDQPENRRRSAQDHPCRHGRLLRQRRAARRPVAARQAGGGRRFVGARRGRCGELRGAGLRRALGHGLGHARCACCPDLIFVQAAVRGVPAGFATRSARSFCDYTPHVEPLSLDEAYLDVTEDTRGIGSATRIAELIRARIKAETGLTASAGVSYNKFIAKLASDQNKPDGLCVIRPGEGAAFVAGLPVRRFHGVGPRGAEKMAALGIETGADLRVARSGIPAPAFRHDGGLSLPRRAGHRPAPGARPTARASRSAPSGPSTAISHPVRRCARRSTISSRSAGSGSSAVGRAGGRSRSSCGWRTSRR